MSDFNTFQNTLPDPNNPIGDGGQNTGSAGPGFASVKLASEHKIMNTRTNSGRLVSREVTGHKWDIDLTYNPMTRDEFDPVYSFLLQKRGSMKPFFVSLPQYKAPKNSGFATYVASSANSFVTTSSLAAGAVSLTVNHSGGTTYNSSTHGTAKPGDLFTIDDTQDTNHTKVYQVVRVESAVAQESGTTNLATNELRIQFIPALQRAVSTAAEVKFNDPQFRVIMKNDIQEYNLNTDNLYSFSLKLEEAQP